jgi:ribosomal protein S18 acetylase RimI-like enzyme
MTENRTEPIVDLVGPSRERAVPVLLDSFTGIYRWHAKRTLREVSVVRGLELDGELAGVAMLEVLAPTVGYVYYIAVRETARRRGVGGRLLDDSMARFEAQGATILYAAVEEDNAPSIALFLSRGFRPIGRDEKNYQEGGLGAWGLRSRMRLVWGEVLLGRRLGPTPPPV